MRVTLPLLGALLLASPALAQQSGGSVGADRNTGVDGRTEGTESRGTQQRLERDQRRTVTVAAAAVVLPAVAGIDLLGVGGERCRAAERDQRERGAVTEEDAALCLSAMLPAMVSGFVPGWPSNADPFADPGAAARYAVRVTAVNLAMHEWARDAAEGLRTAALSDQVAAESAVASDFRKAAPAIFARYAGLRAQLRPEAVQIIGDGSCGFGWKLAAHKVCGDHGAMEITRAGTQWAGGDLLAGARIELTFADAATLTRDRGGTTTTTTTGTTGATSSSGIRAGN
jgi:hypothetical protein